MTRQDTEKAIKLRERVKKKKPKFARPESWRYVRLKESWRRPRGLDNKMRRKIKGWPQTVNTGYRGPKIARGLHPSGYKEVLVHNDEQLRKIDPKSEVIRIAHTVGKRKRAKILTEARKKKIIILNFREVKEITEEERELAEEKKEELEKEEEIESPETKQQEEKTKKRKRRKEKQ